MKIAIDFHIHTALSPCADEDMTPNNIINMCILKGLDAIAITDHNSVENCRACMELGENKGILVIPGMEVQTKEEVHLICLFEDINTALAFQKLIYGKLPKKENNPKFFGRQIIFNEKDEVIRENNMMLIASVDLSINEVFHEVYKLRGIIIPAHVDRSSYSLIGTLGFIPEKLSIKTLEVSKRCNINAFLGKYSIFRNYRFIQNSDAHHLWDILERESFIEVNKKDIKSIFDILR
ncbi:PHP domain-containing protein [Crassaminicella indica]|uniref:PHP domain-containing protein n=1 Tax=Crassaminicella indica TaxID=2855394 RepID=A0ABX8R9M6_9CLOT|nr:PHP domain-containing protein [Crassaminicella indica]QXM05744.1 PHP domain-containing protein [Crassaminicella indica]